MAETTHDCGELGGLAQSRKRFLLVARYVEKVPPFLYKPEKKSLRAVGDILGRMPLPGDIEAAGPMHRVPALQWKTWVRLALVRAGSDWRERIGNAVPPAAAEAIAGVMGTTLLLAEAGETFMLSNTTIWVRSVAVALSVAQQEVQP
ncbi:C-5 cytosine-specific DNA methylase [Pseudomonas paraeruginosa]|nr:C-5 cytosine-specific DNA methylase [Pseudomonas aeruginosa]